MFRTLSSIEVSAIMPRGAAGSGASDKIYLSDRLGLMSDAFGRLLGIGLGVPSGTEETTGAGGRRRFRRPLRE